MKNSRLAVGALGSFSLKIASTLLGLLITVTLARLLGPGGYGSYAYVLALVSLVAIPAQVGLPMLVVRETAKAQVESNWALMKGLWKWAVLVVLSISLIIAMAAFSIYEFGLFSTGPYSYYTLVLGLALIPLIGLGNLAGAATRGLRRVVIGLIPEFIARQTSLLIFVFVLVYFYRGELNPDSALTLYVFACFFAWIVGVVLLKRVRPAPLKLNPRPEYRSRQWFVAMFPLALMAGMQVINQNTDVIMLGYFWPSDLVGVYKVVLTGAATVAFGLQAVTLSVAPQFARLYTQGEKAKLQRLVTQSARMILFLSLPVVVGLVAFGEQLLTLLFGVEYAIGATALAILAVGQLVNAYVGSVGVLLSMTGHEKDTAIGVGVAAVVNVVLNFMLIPKFGIEGAASATAISVVVWNIILWRLVNKRLGLESMAYGFIGIRKE